MKLYHVGHTRGGFMYDYDCLHKVSLCICVETPSGGQLTL